MSYILAALAFIITALAWLLHGATNNRLRDAQQELDEWSGVTDVRRKTRDNLNDHDYIERVQDEFNDK